jgi:amino acid adenylation domain-containing protein
MKKYKKFSKENIADIIALTPMQEGMLFFYLKEPEKNHYFEQLSLKISGKIDIDCFEQAWNFVIETNEMLRTVFWWKKLKSPTQIVLKKHTLTLRYHDFFSEGIGESIGWIEEIKVKDRNEMFDLREVPFRVTLCKVEEDKYEMIISNHHILYDGWSNGIILREFLNAYNDLTAGKVPFIPAKTSFKEFVKWNQQQDTKKQEIFWREYLRGVDRDNRIEIPIKRGNIKDSESGNSKEESGVRNYRYRMTFNGEKGDGVRDFVKAHKITAAALLYGVWGILLQKYTNSSDVIFGTTVSGRSAKIKGIENMVGLFINTIPLRVRTSTSTSTSISTGCSTGERQSLVRMLVCLSETLQTREAYENTPLVKINECIQRSDNEDIFDSIVVIENYPLDTRQLEKSGPLRIDSFSIVEATHYDLTVVIQVSDSIDINFIYQDWLFDDVVIRRLGTHFTCIIREILENPWKDISEIDILSPEEKQQILEDFNRTAVDYPREKTIHQLFEEQAEKAGDKIAVISVEHGAQSMGRRTGIGTMSITYRELNEKSNQLARVLQAEGVGKKGITGIMIHRSLEMVYGVLAILKIGSAYLPVDPDYPQERIHYMLMDSRSNLLLTGNIHNGSLEEGPKVIDIENEEIYSGDPSNLPTAGKSDNPAYVIYTSGTTGRPKGVLVEHINVVRLVKNTNYIAFYPQGRLLQTGALEFDASTFEIWGTLLNGAGLVLVSKETILNHVLLKNVIRKCSISIMWLTSSLFNQVSDIELFAGLTHLLVGGDVLSPPHINRVRKRFPHLKVINGYGPTENTTFSTTYLIDDHDPDRESHKKFPIGKPIANSTAYIVDKNNHLMPVGVPGELIVGGDGVSRGYLNNPELTAEKFDQDFQDDQDDQDEKGPAARGEKKGTGKYFLDKIEKAEVSHHSSFITHRSAFYRTGDLARWLPDGNIEFLGRMDRQVKVRGFRVELEEIQNVLLKHKDIEEAAVISRNDETGENYLCAYVVGSLETSQISGLRDYLSGKLPGYMIPSYFVVLDQLPLTPNGKLDRKALPDVETISGTGTEYCAPRNEREEKLIKIWANVLGIEAGRIGIDDDFFQSGGHSLKAIRLISHIHQAFDTEITLTRLFQSPTIRKLSLYMDQTSENKHSPIELAEKKEYYMLSSGQKRLIVLQTLDPDNIAYNIPYIMVLEGEVEKETIKDIFLKLIDRHESLRTSFQSVEEEVVQKIHDVVDFAIEYYDKKPSTPVTERCQRSIYSDIEGKNTPHMLDPGRCEDIIKMFVRPFDLSRAPLLRAGLIREMESRYLLVIDIHHIIADGVSEAILINELTALYTGEELPPLKLQYKDYSEWQQHHSRKEAYKQQEAFWLKAFEGEIPMLNMPTDFSRPEIQNFEGNVKGFELSRSESDRLKEVARSEGATLFMVLLAVYNVFLSKICCQENIVVGVPIAGRKHADLDNIIGIFVNTLALRNDPRGERSFREFLRSVKKRTLEAFENQDYQFEDLVAKVLVDRDAGRNPVFDVMFTSNNWGKPVEKPLENEINKLNLETMEYKTSRFDLILHSFEREETIGFMFEYSTKLYKKETIERFAIYLKKVVSSVVNNPGIKLSEIEIVSDEEKGKLIQKIKKKKSKIIMELAERNKTQGQAARLSADFDY